MDIKIEAYFFTRFKKFRTPVRFTREYIQTLHTYTQWERRQPSAADYFRLYAYNRRDIIAFVYVLQNTLA